MFRSYKIVCTFNFSEVKRDWNDDDDKNMT